jgi:imidazole glycerol-phosphate synthase subunit HisH
MLAVIDYKAGNLTSVKRALDYLGIDCSITADPIEVLTADRIIFPGVGAAGAAMATLQERKLDKAIKAAFARGTPVFGICIGAQVALTRSEEGDTACLDIIPGICPRFQLRDPALKVPHMGWDSIRLTQPHPMLKTVQPRDEFYFVHSFYPKPDSDAAVFATCEYEVVFPVAIGLRNLFAVQFHPEKSGEAGLALLRTFSTWDGRC